MLTWVASAKNTFQGFINFENQNEKTKQISTRKYQMMVKINLLDTEIWNDTTKINSVPHIPFFSFLKFFEICTQPAQKKK